MQNGVVGFDLKRRPTPASHTGEYLIATPDNTDVFIELKTPVEDGMLPRLPLSQQTGK